VKALGTDKIQELVAGDTEEDGMGDEEDWSVLWETTRESEEVQLVIKVPTFWNY
jgi:hypothetical protein